MKKNNLLIISGLVLILLGAAFNIWMFISRAYPTYLYLIVMGIGIFNVLAGLLLASIKTIWQCGIVAAPFIVLYILYLVNRPSDDTFLIPEDFRGTVYVYYDQPHGVPQEYEHGRRLYRIPGDGILLTQLSIKGGVIDLSGTQYFTENKSHQRHRLPQGGIHEVRDSNIIQAIYGECGSDRHGTYQTIYIGYPSRKFYDEIAASERTHDSIMQVKVNR